MTSNPQCVELSITFDTKPLTMKALYIFSAIVLSALITRAQNEEASGSLALTATSMVSYTNLTTSQCGTNTYNLGVSASPQTTGSGAMNNDVWFHFVAVAEVAKIKVCNPSSFNANLEVWNATATGTPLASSNTNGVGLKEVVCISSLVMGNTYKVRVGRSDGPGAGTFNILYEHLAVSIRSNFFPDPPGAATCYNLTTNFKRTTILYPTGNTRWKFMDGSGNVYGPYTTAGDINNFNISSGVCENLDSVIAYVEIQATDADCGNIWWGYSIGRKLNLCGSLCPTVSIENQPCGGTFCNIFASYVETSFVGDNLQFQFKFVTDNGQTEFITPWSSSSVFVTNTPPYVDYFRYGKVYQIYVRAKRCNNNPQWCGPCTFNTCGMPYANILATNSAGLSNYCLWRNKTGPLIEAASPTGMDQYRFRLMPVDPCAANPFVPTGGALTTGWSYNYYFSPASYPIPLGQVYIIQAQSRVLPANYTNANGQLVTIPGQQSDWSWPCFVGFRNTSSPPEGSSISCCSFPTPPSAGMLPDEYWGENRWTEFYEWEDEPEPVFETGKITLMGFQGNDININTSESWLYGSTLCEIYNMNGQLIQSSQIAAIHENDYVTINTQEELPGGIYLVTLSSPQGRVTGKILITH